MRLVVVAALPLITLIAPPVNLPIVSLTAACSLMHRDSFQDVTVYGKQNFQGYVPNLTPQGERCYSDFVNSKSFERVCASIPTPGTAMGFLIFIDKTESSNGRTYYPCFMVSLHLPPQLRRMRVRAAHATCHRAAACAAAVLTLC